MVGLDTGVFDAVPRVIMFLNGFDMSVITCVFYYAGSYGYGEDTIALSRAQAFCTLTAMHVVHLFCSRSHYLSLFHRSFVSNSAMFWSLLVSTGLVLFGVYVPGFNTVLGMAALEATAWAWVALACGVHLVFMELEKVVTRRVRGKSEQEVCCNAWLRCRGRLRHHTHNRGERDYAD